MDVWPICECTSYVNYDVPLLSMSLSFFLTLSPVQHLGWSFLRKWLADFNSWLFQKERSIRNIWLISGCTSSFSCDVALLSVLLFIFHSFILLFYHSVFLQWPNLIASREIFCVIISTSYLMLCHFTAYFGHFFLYFISFFYLIRISCPYLVLCQFIHIFYSKFYAVLCVIIDFE